MVFEIYHTLLVQGSLTYRTGAINVVDARTVVAGPTSCVHDSKSSHSFRRGHP